MNDSKAYYPANPEEPTVREERLTVLIDQLETLITENITYVSTIAISHLHQAREELAAEHRLLQRGII